MLAVCTRVALETPAAVGARCAWCCAPAGGASLPPSKALHPDGWSRGWGTRCVWDRAKEMQQNGGGALGSQLGAARWSVLPPVARGDCGGTVSLQEEQ